MPTIEIISLNCSELSLNPDNFRVAIRQESELISHRGLFYNFLISQQGAMIHVGNPDLKFDKNGGFFAGQIIDWNFEEGDIELPASDFIAEEGVELDYQSRFQFLGEYKADVDAILKLALRKSQVKKLFFLTDYQFGPEQGTHELISTIAKFWHTHDNYGLAFNTLYEMHEE